MGAVNLPEKNNIKPPLSDEIGVEELRGRVCYFSLFGDIAYDAFEENVLRRIRKNSSVVIERELTERLYFSILMFDIIVIHCSDPLRKEVVFRILQKHMGWIEEGRIVFVFPNSIDDIQTQYKAYIKRKISEYDELAYCENERDSLQKPHITEEYTNNVIEMLCKSRMIVRKPDADAFDFAHLVTNDLDGLQEQIILSTSPDQEAHINAMDLTLRQLMSIKYNVNGKLLDVFPHKTTEEIRARIKRQLKLKSSIGRSAIVKLLRDSISNNGNDLSIQQNDVLQEITLRMDLLYCRMNSGNQVILEFHPSCAEESLYQMACFNLYLKELTRSRGMIKLSKEKVEKLMKQTREMLQFRSLFLLCMADAKEILNINPSNITIETAFKRALRNNRLCFDEEMGSIVNILMEGI